MAISLKDVSVTYGVGTPFEKQALKNVNIEFPKGKVTGIIGHTGSGKSTLAMLLNGLMKPTSGTVCFEDEDIWQKTYDRRSLRFKVGLVFQYPEYQLFAETVGKDIAFGPTNMGLSTKEIEERVFDAARFCGIDESVLERSPFELSGGQKRRAAIAGVVAMKPDVFVLDEPAAGLDPAGREEILSGIIDYSKKRNGTTLIISHSMEDIAKYSDYILVMFEGQVYMFDTVETVFQNARKLFDAKLDLPQITKLFIELEKRGLCADTSVYTVEYAKRKLEKMIIDQQTTEDIRV